MYAARSLDTKNFLRNGDLNGNGRRHHHDDYSKATFIPLSPTVEYTRKTWWDNLLREHPCVSPRDVLSLRTLSIFAG